MIIYSSYHVLVLPESIWKRNTRKSLSRSSYFGDTNKMGNWTIWTIIHTFVSTNQRSSYVKIHLRKKLLCRNLKLCTITREWCGLGYVFKSNLIQWISTSCIKSVWDLRNVWLSTIQYILIFDSISELISLLIQEPSIDMIRINWVSNTGSENISKYSWFPIRQILDPSSRCSSSIETHIWYILGSILIRFTYLQYEILSAECIFISDIEFTHSFLGTSLNPRSRKRKSISIWRKCIRIIWTIWESEWWSHPTRARGKRKRIRKCHRSTKIIIGEIFPKSIYIFDIHLSWITFCGNKSCRKCPHISMEKWEYERSNNKSC